MAEKLASLRKKGGGSDKYDMSPVISLAGGTILSYNTKGKAKAIWVLVIRQDSVTTQICTNVNPTTGEIDNSDTYYISVTSSTATNWVSLGNPFIVTDNNITMGSALSGGARKVLIAYTY